VRKLKKRKILLMPIVALLCNYWLFLKGYPRPVIFLVLEVGKGLHEWDMRKVPRAAKI